MRIRPLLILSAACLAASCDKQPAPPPTQAEVVASQQNDTIDATPAPQPVVSSSIPAAFIVSTNEPFWHATVEGNSVALKGPDTERTLTIDTNEAMADNRHVTAHDKIGRLEIHVSNQACQDDMSGADFPFTGTLSFDGAEASKGCARRTSDPMPVAQ